VRGVIEVFELAKKLTIAANTSLRKDVLSLLRRAYSEESERESRYFLKLIIDNAETARKRKIPICQDTGLPIVFLEVGRNISLNAYIVDAVRKGVLKGYEEAGLRASFVDALNRGTPFYSVPFIHIEYRRDTEGLKITVLPKGFGSENKTRLKMLNPTATQEEIEEFIVESVRIAGPDACPPFVVGVGIGGTSDYALLLAKKALLENLTRDNPQSSLKRWEKKILKKINSLRIGVMGLGGRYTSLAVRIKTAPTHIAGLPVGINISCHALRSATGIIKVL